MLPAKASYEPAPLRSDSLFSDMFKPPPGDGLSMPPFLDPAAPPYGLGVTLMTSLRFGRLAFDIKGLDVGEPFWKALPM